MIKTSYDPQADAMFLWLAPEGVKSVETKEVEPGVILDFGDNGRLIGIEVLDVRSRIMTYPILQRASQELPAAKPPAA